MLTGKRGLDDDNFQGSTGTTDRQVRSRYDSTLARPRLPAEQELLAEVQRLRATVQLQETQLEILSSSGKHPQDYAGVSEIAQPRRPYFNDVGMAHERDSSAILRGSYRDLGPRDSSGVMSRAVAASSSPRLSSSSASAGGGLSRTVDAQSKQIGVLQRMIQDERALLAKVDPGSALRQPGGRGDESQLRDLARLRNDLQGSQDPYADGAMGRLPMSDQMETTRRRIETLRNLIRNEEIANRRLEDEQLLQQALLQRKMRAEGPTRDSMMDFRGSNAIGAALTSDMLGRGGPDYATLSRELALRKLEEQNHQSRMYQPLSRGLEDDRKPLASDQVKSEERSQKRERAHVRRSPVPLSLDGDEVNLSKSQQLIRSALEFFQASKEDVILNAQCRRNPIQLYQVGLRCKFCAHEFLHRRGRGSVYYPARIAKVYQAAQNIAMTHLLGTCIAIPEELRESIKKHRETRGKGKTSTGGRGYWVESCTGLGLVDHGEDNGIWFTTKNSNAAKSA